MYFDSFSEFIAMGNHGPYVWGAYGVTVIVIAGLLITAARRKSQLTREIRQQARREAS